ncbi:MAG: ABC transporter permease [Chloroflexi bacterium]|nr:ABC transporter permease [Chloroflexota bacterium]
MNQRISGSPAHDNMPIHERSVKYIKKSFIWWKTYRKSKVGVLGLAVLIIMILLAVLAPVLAPYNPRAMIFPIWSAPNSTNWLGTTSVGQDVLSNFLYAGRTSLLLGIATAAITQVAGVAVGVIAGYFGGLVDEFVIRTSDIVRTIPQLPILILLSAFLGPGIPTIMLVISVTGWTHHARSVRALTLVVKQYPFVESTRAMGASRFHIIRHHIIPNLSGAILSSYIMGIVGVIGLETGLSFLGFGDPLRPSWGQMLYFAQRLYSKVKAGR